jgi:excisionase family DNA binding protein
MNDIELLGTKKAAAMLGLSQDHVRRLLEQGKLKGKRIGNSWVVLDLNYERKRKLKTRKGGKQDGTSQ